MGNVQTKEWSTGFFLFDIGLFQGCVLSTILFDCVFQLLLDMLAPNKHLGYTYKGVDITKLDRAYADDLALSTKNTKCMQTACDITDVFLDWTRTMMAKPVKCVCAGFRQFDKRTDSGKFVQVGTSRYAPFDPGVSISGKKMRFMLDVAVDKSSIKRDHFKFLGRWISISLSEEKVKATVKAAFKSDLETIEGSKVNGLMKLWLYQHYALAHLSWPFLVHDFNYYFSVSLEDIVNSRLKKWAKLFRGAEVGCLFRARSSAGLGLTSISQHFSKMQIIRSCLLQNSEDPNVRALYSMRASKTVEWKIKWSAEKATKAATADAVLSLRFPSHIGRRGLGHGDFSAQPSKADFRKMVVAAADRREQERLSAHSHGLARQGVWTQWHESTLPFDLSWKNLIYGPGPHVISFVLNATINSLHTPDMMKLWGYKSSASCVLCGHHQCTLHHILAGCSVALKQKRFTWRHDSVLLHLEKVFRPLINKHNKSDISSGASLPPLQKSFVKSGVSSRRAPAARLLTLLDGANDWRIQFDYDHCMVPFPLEIYSTSERPDVVIWSASCKKAFLIELTVPAEEGIEAAMNRKQGRYAILKSNINSDENSSWSASVLTIEVGARGFVGRSLYNLCRKLGTPGAVARATCKSISTIAAKCSYELFLLRSRKSWVRDRALLELEFPKEVRAPVPSNPESRDESPEVQNLDEKSSSQTIEVVKQLRLNGVFKLYHFTDRSNLDSILRNGLVSWYTMEQENLKGRCGGNQASREMDESKGLEDFVRLSFTRSHPMMFVCAKDGRVPDPVILEISLNVVSRPGTLFSNMNANASNSKVSRSPNFVHFGTVLKHSQFHVSEGEKPFFQAEVLIKSRVPPHLIVQVLDPPPQLDRSTSKITRMLFDI